MLAGQNLPDATQMLPEHQSYMHWTDQMPSPPGDVNMAEIVKFLRENLPDDAIMTNGAGITAPWLHRFYHFRHHQSQLAPTSGSMGRGHPRQLQQRRVIQNVLRFVLLVMVVFNDPRELATARQIGANIMVLVIDNGMYGTIKMHQEINFPGCKKHTDLINPDFCTLGDAMRVFIQKK